MLETVTKPAYPSLKQTWGLLGITILAALVLNILFLLLGFVLTQAGSAALSETIISHPLTMLLTYVMLFFFIIWIAIRKKTRAEGHFSPNYSLPSPLSILLITIATLGIYFLVDPLVDLIPMPEFIEQLFLQLLGDQTIWSMITLVIAAPICEELLLRGIILDGLLKIYSPGKAVIWSAVFFGLFHLNPWQFIPALALGLFMGWIYYRTRSLAVTMLIHFIANGTGTLLGWLFMPESQDLIPTRELIGNNVLYFSLLALALLLTVFSIFILNKNFKTQKKSTTIFF